MDPGNWATNIAAGSQFGYTLLIAVLLSSGTAMFLQHLSLKLGVACSRDLAQACRDAYPTKVAYGLWFIAEVAIASTDLAEVIGSAVAFNLLFGLPIWAGVLITAADVLFIILFGIKHFRLLEILVMSLCMVITGCFAYEVGAAKPDWADVASGFIPKGKIVTNSEILYAAIGILGATVMPHNLFLHSSIVQTRAFARSQRGRKCAVNAVFHYGKNPNSTVADITTAFRLLEPALGNKIAPKLFAIALLCSGQQATITGTLSGQIVMEGFLKIRIPPWARRLLTRLIAIIPAAIVAAVLGNEAVGKLLVLSQVLLSLTLTFAVVPLVQFTSTHSKMKEFTNPLWIKIIGILVAAIIAGLNCFLVVKSIKDNSFGTA
ncbi:Metal transporter nramp1, variant 2 [Trebouxia sp. C0009 RCD-2024]